MSLAPSSVNRDTDAADLVTPDAVRRSVRSWLTESWDPELALLDWRHRLVESGWAAPSWPMRWHWRDLPSWADGVVAEELAAAGRHVA